MGNMANRNKLVDVGGAWKSTSKSGNEYISVKLSGPVRGKLMLFPNKFKKIDEQPDYRVMQVSQTPRV